MDGLRGLSGWRWLFIIDGIVTLPVALYGFLLFPDTPARTRAFYLTPAERALAVARVPPVRDGESPLTWRFARHVLTSWYWWGFVGLWVIAGETESFSSNSLMSLYLKGHPAVEYTVAQLNDIPTGVPAVGIVSTLFWATLTDLLDGKRYLVGYFIGATGVATSAMILAASRDPTSPRSTAVVFGAYYWAGAVYACQATFFAWCNDAMRFEEPVFRGVVLAGMNLGNNAVNAWWSIIFYGASMAPWFKVSAFEPAPEMLCGGVCELTLPRQHGMWAMIACSIALVIWCAGLSWFHHKDEVRRKLDGVAQEASSPEAVEAQRSSKDETRMEARPQLE